MPQSLADLAYRTVANVVGGPVDLATMVLRPFGYSTPDPQVIGGSEWIGKKMEQAGLIGQERAPIRELVASLLTPSPAALASKAMFIGGLAKTWNASAATKAKELEQLGVDARKIWQETGTWRGPDGKWRQEIDDLSSTFKAADDPYWMKYSNQRLAHGGKIESVFQHPELAKTYPETLQIPFEEIRLNPELLRPGGVYGYNKIGSSIDIYARNPQEARSIALHELQHAIQEREGFARGGAPEMFGQQKDAELARDALSWRGELMARKKDLPGADMMSLNNAAVQEYSRLGALDMMPSREARALAMQPEVLYPQRYPNAEGGFDDLTKLVSLYGLDKAVTPKSSMNIYKSLAGEAEARAVQTRMNMTPEQRRATFPEESYDVPIKNLVFLK